MFSIHDPSGVKLLNRLRLNFSHLKEHKFHHGFKDTVNAMCNCGAEIETTEHYLLRCRLFSTQRLKLLDDLYRLDPSIKEKSNDCLINLILFGSDKYDNTVNKNILTLTISFIKSSGRFNGPLTDH